MGKDSSLDNACDRSIQIDESNSNHSTTSHKKTNEITRKKLPVTVIIGDSIVKEVKGWKLSDKKNKVLVKHFSGAKQNTYSLISFPPSNKILKQLSVTLGLKI